MTARVGAALLEYAVWTGVGVEILDAVAEFGTKGLHIRRGLRREQPTVADRVDPAVLLGVVQPRPLSGGGVEVEEHVLVLDGRALGL
jgi:hypothetical protein